MGYAVCLIFLFCAFIGILVSVYLAYKGLINDGYNLRIDVYKGYSALAPVLLEPSLKAVGERMLLIKLVNVGSETLVLEAPDIRLTDGMIIDIPGYIDYATLETFPCKLVKGRSFILSFPWVKIQQLLIGAGYSRAVGLKIEIRDKTGREFESKRNLLIDLGER